MDDHLMLAARALVLTDLTTAGRADAESVSLLEDAVSSRTWWAEQWPEGATYVAGLVAQDVQDALQERADRWPVCRWCDEETPHTLYIHPDLGGPEPTWVCEESGQAIAPLGELPQHSHR